MPKMLSKWQVLFIKQFRELAAGISCEFLIIIRFLDDWAYQANVRQMLTEPDPEKCKELMKPFEEKLWKIFGVIYNVNYKFPWNRLFEVEIELS